MATATSRKAKPDPKILKARRATAEKRLDIEIRLGKDYAEIAKLDADLKLSAMDSGESFKEDFGARGFIAVAPPHAAEFKGDVPQVVTEAWQVLKPAERKKLVSSGLIKIEPQWGKASGGRVTVKVL